MNFNTKSRLSPHKFRHSITTRLSALSLIRTVYPKKRDHQSQELPVCRTPHCIPSSGNVWPKFAYVCPAYPFLRIRRSISPCCRWTCIRPVRSARGCIGPLLYTGANKWLAAQARVPGWSPITSPKIGYCAKTVFPVAVPAFPALAAAAFGPGTYEI